MNKTITILGFSTAIGTLVTLIYTYLYANQYGGVVTIDTNHYGEWGFELVLFAASLIFIVYAMVDYLKMVGEQ
jgi:hypothetical protein